MEEHAKKTRQKYFVPKELRYSIAFIVIWSLVAGVILIYLAKQLGGFLQDEILPFVVIMLGYSLVVVIFTMIFSNRFIGPFERLKLEIRLVLAGDYDRRLVLRKNDDIYIKSFISEVNRLVDEFERQNHWRRELIKAIDSELIEMIAVIEEQELSREEQIGRIVTFHNRIKRILEAKD